MYEFKGREWYREMHEYEIDPVFEDVPSEDDEDEEDKPCQ